MIKLIHTVLLKGTCTVYVGMNFQDSQESSDSLFFPVVMYIPMKGFPEQAKYSVGLDFVHWELIGWLWFSIGGSLM